MNLTNAATTINLDSYERNGEWEIVSTEVIKLSDITQRANIDNIIYNAQEEHASW